MRARVLFPLTATAITLAGLVVAAGPTGPEGGVRPDLDVLRARVELASAGGFYLVVDPNAARVQLLFGGALLEEYPILRLEVGTPRRAFFRQEPRVPWAGRVRAGGMLSPARTPAAAPPEGSDADAWVPPPPEELFPAPDRYEIRFEDLVLQVSSATPGSAGMADRLRHWAEGLVDAARLLLGLPHESVRIRLHLDPAVAGAFFRGLPDATRLLVLPLAPLP